MDRFPNSFFQDIPSAGGPENFFLPVWREVLAAIPAPTRILDFGCGTGAFGIDGKRLTGATLTGVDGSDFAIAQARAAGYDETCIIDNLDQSALPFADGSFDFCVCKDVLEHLLDPEHAVGEIVRVLRPGGHVVVQVPNHFTLRGRLRMLWRNDLDTYGYFPAARRWNFPHIRFFTEADLQALLALCGLPLRAGLSQHFPSIPGGRFVVPVAAWRRALAGRWPDAFAEGLTMLAAKPANPV